MRGRIRSIKPDIGKHEGLWDLGVETGLPVYQAYTMLWCYADREGRFEWRPRSLKTDILPYWDGDFSRVLDALVTRGFIVRYVSGTREFGSIPSFKRHQVVNNRETESELPAPEECVVVSVASTRAPRVDDACPTPLTPAQVEGKGREGNGKGIGRECDATTTRAPKAPRPKAERFVPETWQPNDAHQAKATELGVLLRREVDSFRSHEFKTPKTDWDRAFHGWLTRSAQFGTSSGPGRHENRFSPKTPKMGEPGWRRQPDAGVVNEADYGWPPDEVANG